MNTSELRRTWSGHTAVESLCDALDTVTAERDELRARVVEVTNQDARRRGMLKYVSGRLLDLGDDANSTGAIGVGAELESLRHEIDTALEAVDREQIEYPGFEIIDDSLPATTPQEDDPCR